MCNGVAEVPTPRMQSHVSKVFFFVLISKRSYFSVLFEMCTILFHITCEFKNEIISFILFFVFEFSRGSAETSYATARARVCVPDRVQTQRYLITGCFERNYTHREIVQFVLFLK